MDDKIKILVDAGLKLNLTQNTLKQLSKLSMEEVEAFAKVCRKLNNPKARQFVIYSDFSTPQPPAHTY